MTTQTEIDGTLERLAAMPLQLASICSGFTDAQLAARGEAETWSANDVLAHLRACADVWGKSLLAMLANDHPTIRYVSPRNRMHTRGYVDLAFSQSFKAYESQRADLLAILAALNVAGWQRAATFTATTRGKHHTVLSYAQRIAEHEVQHCQQMAAVLIP